MHAMHRYGAALLSTGPILVALATDTASEAQNVRPKSELAGKDAPKKESTVKDSRKAPPKEKFGAERTKKGPPVGSPPIATTRRLWDRLGGEKGVTKVVDEFMSASLSDPKV